jgi:hypothetical protein
MDERLFFLQRAFTESTVELEIEVSNVSVLPERIPCHVCQHDIPTSEALFAEATDYVMYFCGLDCYERWRSQLVA